MKKSRDYQLEGVHTVFDKLKNNVNRQLFVMATGLGKTYVGCQIIKVFNEQKKRVLWITHTEELIDQSAKAVVRELMDIEDSLDNHDSIIHFLNDDNTSGLLATPIERRIREQIGVIKRERMDLQANVQVASIQTLQRRLEKISASHYDCVIVDECHMAMAATWLKTINYFQPKLLLGLTATPERTDGISLSSVFDEITFERNIQFGIENGYLVPLNGVRVKTEINIDSIKTQGGDFNVTDAEKLLNTPARNKLIADKWKEYANGRPSIGFCVDVRHAMDITEMFNSCGIRATFVVADEELCPDRLERISDFKKGLYDVLFNVMILTAGADFPKVSCIIMARPTKSKTLFLQAVGRGTRTLPGVIDHLETPEERIKAIEQSDKKETIILDIVDSTNRHQLVNTYTLDKDLDAEDKVFINKEKRDKLIAHREQQKKKILHIQEKDEVVNLIALPKAKKMQRNANTLQEATPNQMDFIKRLGIFEEGTSYTKLDAFEVISNMPATAAQIYALGKMGFDVSKGVTRGQADAAFKAAEAAKEKRTIEQIKSKLPISGIN